MASDPNGGFPAPPPGPPPPDGYGYGQSAPLPTGKAVASLVCGIVGLLLFGIVLGPIAIGLGVSAKNDPRQGGDGMATAGIVLGIIATVLSAFVLILVLG